MTTSDDEPAAREEPPVMPTADEAAAEAPEPGERPAPVRYAFVVWVLTGLAGIASAIELVSRKQELIDLSIQRNRNPSVRPEDIAQGATTTVWMFMIAAVVFAVLFALFAYKAQDAVRRARLLLAMLCLLTVAFYVLFLPTPLGIMTGLLSVIGTVLLHLPASNKFFAPRELPT